MYTGICRGRGALASEDPFVGARSLMYKPVVRHLSAFECFLEKLQ